MNEVAIYTQSQSLQIKEYQGQRVVTFKDIDTLHQRPDGTARGNFNENCNRFIEGEDYFKVCAYEIRTHKILEISNKAREDITLLTQFGYLMLVKSFTDDLAWHIQRQLVKNYFENKMQVYDPVNNPQLERLINLLERQYQSTQPLQIHGKRYNQNALEEAKDFLKEILADGKKTSKEVHMQAKECGISKNTLLRAKSTLNINCQERKGFGGDMVVFWQIPIQFDIDEHTGK